MLPIASSSGPAFIGVVVIAAALFLWWLLRAESRDDADAKATQKAERRAEGQTTQAAERAAAQKTTPGAVQQPAPAAEEDRLSAP